jgi:SAM-dependent methyltransferase
MARKHQASRIHWDNFWKKRSTPFPVILSMTRVVVNLLRAREVSAYVEDGRVLEIGCGTATGSIFLEKRCPKSEIVAVDTSLQALKLASRNCKKNKSRISLLLADALRLPFVPNSFDLVWSSGVLEHFADAQPPLRAITSILTIGGRIVILVPTHNNLLVKIRDAIRRFTGLYLDFNAAWGGEAAYPTDVPSSCRSLGLKIISHRNVAWELFVESITVASL